MFDKNMNLPRAIISAIILCGKQNISLRGQRDDSKSTASVNKGNFHAILMLLSNSVDDLKEHLTTHWQGNATSPSKTVREKVLDITGAYVRSKATPQKIQKENAFPSIISDELTDK